MLRWLPPSPVVYEAMYSEEFAPASNASSAFVTVHGVVDKEEMLDPTGAEMADKVATALNAAATRADNMAQEILCCYTSECGSTAFATINKDGGLSLLTEDGIISIKEPESWNDVMTSPQKGKWLESMQIEYNTFKEMNTYRLVPLSSVPKGSKVFRLAWKYKLKRKGDMTLDKYKSRCVLMGNFMRKGRDYLESFAVGARMMSVKMIYAICAVLDWEDFLLDIKGAFLLTEKPTEGVGSTTFVHQPRGFEETGPNGEPMVGVLNTYVYGDPAAGRAWMLKFDKVLIQKLGAEADDIDPNLFRVNCELGHIIFAKHVDEMIGAASTEAARVWVHETISAHLEVGLFTRWGTVLGFNVTRDRQNKTVKIDGERLITDIAKRRGVNTDP